MIEWFLFDQAGTGAGMLFRKCHRVCCASCKQRWLRCHTAEDEKNSSLVICFLNSLKPSHHTKETDVSTQNAMFGLWVINHQHLCIGQYIVNLKTFKSSFFHYKTLWTCSMPAAGQLGWKHQDSGGSPWWNFYQNSQTWILWLAHPLPACNVKRSSLSALFQLNPYTNRIYLHINKQEGQWKRTDTEILCLSKKKILSGLYKSTKKAVEKLVTHSLQNIRINGSQQFRYKAIHFKQIALHSCNVILINIWGNLHKIRWH